MYVCIYIYIYMGLYRDHDPTGEICSDVNTKGVPSSKSRPSGPSARVSPGLPPPEASRVADLGGFLQQALRWD